MAKGRNESDVSYHMNETKALILELKEKAQDPHRTAQVLSLLVPLVRKKAPRKYVLRETSESLWLNLLDSQEAKVRKNASRVIGEVYRTFSPQKPEGSFSDTPKTASASSALAKKLYQLLLSEQVQMVRPSYILAIGAIGSGFLLDDYQVPEGTVEKHAREEEEALRKVRSAAPALLPERAFADYPSDRDLILVTGAGEKRKSFSSKSETGKNPADDGTSKTAGERALQEGAVWKKLQKDRTWMEILIPIQGPEEILPLCRTCLCGDAPYRYRIELKSEDKEPKRSSHEGRGYRIRRLIEQIESVSKDTLINDPSHYEIEVRIETGADMPRGRWYVKLSCAPDHRFDYRKETIPAAIHPANAAMIIRLAKSFIQRESRRILDPCCGSGTLLIERAKAKIGFRPLELVGLDIEPRAVRAAKRNLAAAFRTPEELIRATSTAAEKPEFMTDWKILQTDLTTWKLPKEVEPFDEIYANLPFGLRVGDHAKNERLYRALAGNLSGWLAPGGIAVLYTMEGRLLEKELKNISDLELKGRFRLEAGGLLPRVYMLKKR